MGQGRVEDALKLVEAGVPVAAAAKGVGVSRSAVYQARAGRAGREGRACTECGAPLPEAARAGALTCSGRCRVARSRRLKAGAAAECPAHPAPTLSPPDAPAPTLSPLAAEVERIRSMRR